MPAPTKRRAVERHRAAFVEDLAHHAADGAHVRRILLRVVAAQLAVHVELAARDVGRARVLLRVDGAADARVRVVSFSSRTWKHGLDSRAANRSSAASQSSPATDASVEREASEYTRVLSLTEELKSTRKAADKDREALEKAKRENFDVVIVDTSGRLSNNQQLNKELKKGLDAAAERAREKGWCPNVYAGLTQAEYDAFNDYLGHPRFTLKEAGLA